MLFLRMVLRVRQSEGTDGTFIFDQWIVGAHQPLSLIVRKNSTAEKNEDMYQGPNVHYNNTLG